MEGIPNIGKSLKTTRQKRKLSLDKLAEITGVSKAMLGQIERGESSPTLNTLWKIATGIKVSFSSLLIEAQGHIGAQLIPYSEITPITEEDGLMKIYPQFIFDSNRGFEMFILELEPGCNHISEPHDHGVEEYINVFEGTMEVVVAEEVYTLTKGDAIRYFADKKHIYRNSSNKCVRFHHLIYYFS